MWAEIIVISHKLMHLPICRLQKCYIILHNYSSLKHSIDSKVSVSQLIDPLLLQLFSLSSTTHLGSRRQVVAVTGNLWYPYRSCVCNFVSACRVSRGQSSFVTTFPADTWPLTRLRATWHDSIPGGAVMSRLMLPYLHCRVIGNVTRTYSYIKHTNLPWY